MCCVMCFLMFISILKRILQITYNNIKVKESVEDIKPGSIVSMTGDERAGGEL